MSKIVKSHLKLKSFNPYKVSLLCGSLSENISFLEEELSVDINLRKDIFYIKGLFQDVSCAKIVINDLYSSLLHSRDKNCDLSIDFIRSLALKVKRSVSEKSAKEDRSDTDISSNLIHFRNESQQKFFQGIYNNSLSFGVGPAGTGKTFIAVAVAVDLLNKKQIKRIVLTRPVVESGERLGFLPGSLSQKIDPYLIPLYDCLQSLLGAEKLEDYLSSKIIEIAPLAYMRGRTLKKSFVILDESQNTTIDQMKMFLTRMGEKTKVVVTGDATQIDLPSHHKSGLSHSLNVLSRIDDIFFHFFSSSDIVRHPLVEKIVNAYSYEESK